MVELRLREIGGGFPQDLIRAPQLAVVALQILQPLTLVSRQTAAHTAVALGLPRPFSEGLGSAAELAGH